MSAAQIFLNTVAVVFGVLSPLMVYQFCAGIWQVWTDYCVYRNHHAELAAKHGPYTKAELRRVPNERMLEIVLFDGDRIAYRLGVDKP